MKAYKYIVGCNGNLVPDKCANIAELLAECNPDLSEARAVYRRS